MERYDSLLICVLATGVRFQVSGVRCQVCIISKLDELSERLPDVVGYLLFNLKSAARIDSDPLQVADHNVDDQITRQIFGGIFGKGYGRRGGYDPLARPEIHKRGVSAP